MKTMQGAFAFASSNDLHVGDDCDAHVRIELSGRALGAT